jgi:hypothetical protein
VNKLQFDFLHRRMRCHHWLVPIGHPGRPNQCAISARAFSAVASLTVAHCVLNSDACHHPFVLSLMLQNPPLVVAAAGGFRAQRPSHTFTRTIRKRHRLVRELLETVMVVAFKTFTLCGHGH